MAPEDIPQLAKMYGVPVQKAMDIWQQKKVATSTTCTVAKDMPTRWQFTASNENEGSGWGHCSCRGIKLDAYHKNPVWTWQHDYNKTRQVFTAYQDMEGKREAQEHC